MPVGNARERGDPGHGLSVSTGSVCGWILIRFFFIFLFESYLKCKSNEVKNKKTSTGEFLKNPKMRRTRKRVKLKTVSAKELIAIYVRTS